MILIQPAHFLSSTWEGIVCTPLPECTWVWVIESYSTGKMGMEQKTTLLFYQKHHVIVGGSQLWYMTKKHAVKMIH